MTDYEADKELIRDFLSNFYTDSPSGRGKEFKYAKRLNKLAERMEVGMTVDLDDLETFVPGGDKDTEKLVEHIEANAKRYTSILALAVSELIPDYRTVEVIPKDALDVFIDHRLQSARMYEDQMHGMDEQEAANRPPVEAQFPPDLLRRFEVYFKPRSSSKPIPLRTLKADKIGKLVTIHGVVIRASEVRPMITVATYTCDQCSAETFQTVNSTGFTPISQCNSGFCKGNNKGGRLQLQTRGSKFVRFQEVKIQEQSGDVPPGHVPRTLTVHCKGENTRQASPGDHVAVTGVLLPLPKKSAFAQMMSGLQTDTFLEAQRISSVSKWDDGEIIGDLTDDELVEYRQADFYQKLAFSIAPEVYGHEDVKKSLLLQLVGGLDKAVGALKIRGSVNICLMGDPGVAKSQLLSYIDRLAPRSQLTSGRGSTGVGLTASIMKDSMTGLLTLEAGALMLADQGICCIDEFDKMQESDRTALHEVMEQQTISIAKAGILATLHARTAVLAAANPAYGRYNPKRSIHENIALPAALLSRFDILWLLQDRHNAQDDKKLAEHIVYVHQHLKQKDDDSGFKPLDMGLMRRYIVACQKVNPVVPKNLSERLETAYVELRKEARNAESDKTFTSPRILLAILRLSTALARLRLSDIVSGDDVNEAIRLVEKSRESITNTDQGQRATRTVTSASEKIAKIFKELHKKCTEDEPSISVREGRRQCQEKGITNEEIDRCLDEYENMDVWHLNQNRTKLWYC